MVSAFRNRSALLDLDPSAMADTGSSTQQQVGVEVEHWFAHLKENDGEWLVSTLRERCKELGYHGRRQERAALPQRRPRPTDSNKPESTSLAGPFDVTAPTLPPGQAISEHVAMVRNFPWHLTELGPMSAWPVELRRMVNFTLQDRGSAVLWYAKQKSGRHFAICKTSADFHASLVGGDQRDAVSKHKRVEGRGLDNGVVANHEWEDKLLFLQWEKRPRSRYACNEEVRALCLKRHLSWYACLLYLPT